MEDYESEFQAPPYTPLDIRIVGEKVVRTVVMDGEVQEFEVSLELYNAGRMLEDGN